MGKQLNSILLMTLISPWISPFSNRPPSDKNLERYRQDIKINKIGFNENYRQLSTRLELLFDFCLETSKILQTFESLREFVIYT